MSNLNSTVSDVENIDSERLISFTQANKILGITNQLGHNWLGEDKYPVPVRQLKRNGNNYVRYMDVKNYIDKLFSEPALNKDTGKAAVKTTKNIKN